MQRLRRGGGTKKYDVIFTNPPFGSKIKVEHEHILRRYDLGHKWKKKDSNNWVKTSKIKKTEPQILFIELCLNLLKDGGRMAIVLPDGIFGNPSDGYIREWIKDKAEVLTVIDCPHNTFMPHTHTKTSVLLLRKWKKTKQENYPIMMSVVEKCGHDTRGNEIYTKNGEEEILDEEFSESTRIYKKYPNRVIKESKSNRLGFTLYEQELKDGIWVPRYYDPDTEEQLKSMGDSGKFDMISIQDLIDERILAMKMVGATVKSSQCSIYDDIPFLRTSDVGAWETRNYAVQNVNEKTYLKYRDKQNLEEGDILFIKDGTYRIGETIILTKHDLKMLVQNHFLNIKSLDRERLDPYFLLYLLHIPIVRKQIDERTFVQSTISTVGDRLNEVILPIPKIRTEKEKIAEKVKEKITIRAQARAEIRDIFNSGIE